MQEFHFGFWMFLFYFTFSSLGFGILFLLKYTYASILLSLHVLSPPRATFISVCCLFWCLSFPLSPLLRCLVILRYLILIKNVGLEIWLEALKLIKNSGWVGGIKRERKIRGHLGTCHNDSLWQPELRASWTGGFSRTLSRRCRRPAEQVHGHASVLRASCPWGLGKMHTARLSPFLQDAGPPQSCHRRPNTAIALEDEERKVSKYLLGAIEC